MMPDRRSPRARRLALFRLAAALALGSGCESEQRPPGLADASRSDIVVPDVPVLEAAVADAPEAGPDAADGGAIDASEGGIDASTPEASVPDVVIPDGPVDECCVDAGTPLTARPLFPRSGGYVASRRPVFRWTTHDGAATYRVEIGSSRTFTAAAVTLATTDGATSIAAPMELSVGRHWWRVVPVRADGTALTPSATWSVIVGRVANDLNGDGYADIAVGAPEHDQGATTDIGRVQVFYGGSLDAVADVTLEGAAINESFGRALSTGGDVNNDGFADLVIAAPFGGSMQSGRVAVYLGGATISSAPTVVLAGPQAMAQFGRCVSVVGDVNGDDYDDVLVATPFFRGGPGANSGQAWIYFGGAAMNAEPDVTFTYTNAGDQLGFSCGAAGDTNGDGFADIAVGAPRNGAAGVDSGGGYVWWGGAPMDTGVDLIVLGVSPGGRLGDALTTLGDANADGYSDLAFGAPGSSGGGPNSGSVIAIAGGTGVIPRPLFTLNGVGAERLGTALAGGVDLDADGYDDLVVGARDNGVGGPLSGRGYVYRGGTGPTPVLGATYAVSMGMMGAGDEFGFAVALIGDANADGFGEVLVGAPNAPTMGTPGPGRVYLFAGGNALVTQPRQTYAPAAPSAFGHGLPRR